MKNVFLLFCLVILALRCSAQYTIQGRVNDVPDGSKLYLILVKHNYKAIDSTTVKGGKFFFKGGHLNSPEWAVIKVDNNFLPMADFYLEDGTITIKGSRYSTKATGTPVNAQYNEYGDSINSMFDVLSRLTSQRAASNGSQSKIDSINAEIKKQEQVLKEREIRFIKRYPSSIISSNVIEYRSRFASSSEINNLLALITPDLRETPEMLKVKDYAQRLAKTENGAIAPAFTLPNDKGKQISLSSFKGKYLLLDFWASWCAPCRASFPLIAELYGKYKSNKFDILGISLDRSESAWRKALSEEKVPWSMVIDQKGDVAHKYAVSTIPHLVLVNPDGKIMGTYDRAEINEELEKILK